MFAVLLAVTSAVTTGGSSAAIRGDVAAGMSPLASLVRHDGEDHGSAAPQEDVLQAWAPGEEEEGVWEEVQEAGAAGVG